MANAVAPYDGPLGKTIDVDPDDINLIVWDVSKDLSDRATSFVTPAQGVVPATLIPTNITAIQGPTVQGTVVTALIKMSAVDKALPHSGTMRCLCANGEQFDRTIYFNLEDH